MANEKAIKAGRAFVEVFADNSKLRRGLKQASQMVKNFGRKVRNIGLAMSAAVAIVSAPLAMSAQHFASYGDTIAKMAKRTGLTTQALSELMFVASQTGTEFAGVEKSIRKMQKSIFDLGYASKMYVDAFKELGITFADLQGLSPEDQFKLIGDRLGRITDDTKQAAIAMVIFGRTGTNLLPMFEQGAAGIERLQQQARALGLSITAEDAAKAEALADAFDAAAKTGKALMFAVGAALADDIISATNAVVRFVVGLINWAKANRPLIASLARIIVMAGAVAVSVVALSTAIIVAGHVIGGIGAIIGAIGMVITTVIAIFGTLTSTAGIVGFAVVTLFGLIERYTGIGGKAIKWFSGVFGQLAATVKSALGGMANALKAGDIGLAVQIMWEGIKLAWLQGLGAIQMFWLKFKTGFALSWELLASSITATITNAIYKVRSLIISVATAWKSTINAVVTYAKMAWATLSGRGATGRQGEKILGGIRGREISGEGKDKQAQLETERLAAIAARKGKLSGIASQFKAEEAEIEARIQKAQKQLADAVAEAQEGAVAAPNFQKFDKDYGKTGSPLDNTTSITGTFNASRAEQLGGGNNMKKAVDILSQINKNTRGLKDNPKLVFG